MTIDERLNAAASAVGELWAEPAATETRYARMRSRLYGDAAEDTGTASTLEEADDLAMDCADFLDHLYEFLDGELSASDSERFAAHLDECSSCLAKYGMEQTVKRLIKRACSHDEMPTDLRAKVMGRIELIRREGSHDSSHQDVAATEQ